MEKLLHKRLRDGAAKTDLTFILDIGDEKVDFRSKHALAIADEIERYYIPRPRFEDGEPVPWGCKDIIWNDGEKYWVFNAIDDKGVPVAIGTSEVASRAEMTDDGFTKRPTPKVYDADGVEIKVGQVLWNITGDKALRILALDTNFDLEPVIQTDDGRFNPDQLTHEKPVFDADNVRIRKGDTVWGTLLGDKHEVSLVKNGCVYLDDGSICFEPNQLTHKEPDSIERILDDATIDPRIYYNDHIGHDVGLHDDAFIIEKFAQHLIKRAALIERGA